MTRLLALVFLFASITVLAVVLAFTNDSRADNDQTKQVPKETLDRLGALAEPSRITPVPHNQQEFENRFAERQTDLLKLGQATLKKYPDAENLIIVRSAMLRAAAFLDYYHHTEDSQQQLLAVCQDILDSDADPHDKLPADSMKTQVLIASSDTDKEQALRQLARRYADTDAAGQALLHAAILAEGNELPDLLAELADSLQADHIEQDGVAMFLLGIGRKVPFSAELTKLDGQTVTLPDDLLGKVVVVEFWATWCQPCTLSMPHMKKLYDQYKGAGLEVVGISLDFPGDLKKVKDFVTDNGYDWIQTFSNQSPDPTQLKYGVDRTPTIWVVGRDGLIISTDAIDQTALTLEKAMMNVDRIVEDALDEPVQAQTQ